jgi:hypothetical protein
LLIFVVANVAITSLVLPQLFSVPWWDTALNHTRHLLQFRCTESDSWHPMFGAIQHIQSGQDELLYQSVFFRQKTKFQYPPTSLIFLYPLSLWTQTAALSQVEILNYASAGFIALGMYFVLRIYLFASMPKAGTLTKKNTAALALLWAGTTLTFFPIVKAYTLGQIQVWINALFAVAFWTWLTGRKQLCGALLGIICLIKPHYGMILFWGLLRRQWSFVLALLLTVLSGLLFSLALFGFANHLDYVHVVRFISRHGEAFFANQSVNGLLNRMFFNGDNLDWRLSAFAPFSAPVYAGTVASSLLLLSLGLFGPVRRRAPGSIVDFAIMALTATMASPVAWEHHYGILLPIYALLTAYLAGRPPHWQAIAVCLGLSYFLTSNYFPFVNRLANTPVNFLQSYVLAGALLLLAVLHSWR